jgi:hypothetical protein
MKASAIRRAARRFADFEGVQVSGRSPDETQRVAEAITRFWESVNVDLEGQIAFRDAMEGYFPSAYNPPEDWVPGDDDFHRMAVIGALTILTAAELEAESGG